MKLRLICPDCPAGITTLDLPTVELRDDGLYTLECPSGHNNLISLQNHHFELLFDLAVKALRDGYPRETVSALTAALERYYELFVQVVLFSEGTKADQLELAWKHVRNQTERQLGAYVMTYLHYFKKAPQLLASDSVGFRNAVIHKGRIPTERQVIEYGEEVFHLLVEGVRELKGDSMDRIGHATAHRLKGIYLKSGKAVRNFAGIRTMIDTTTSEISSFGSFEEAVQKFHWVHGRHYV